LWLIASQGIVYFRQIASECSNENRREDLARVGHGLILSVLLFLYQPSCGIFFELVGKRIKREK